MATRDEIYLAALLHDIGKFWQRADENGLSKSNIIPSDFKQFKSTFCPKNENGFSHKHVMWTAYFIDKYQNEFKSLLKNEKDKTLYGDLMHLAANHHHPATLEEKIVQKADHYSAGLDRTLENGWKDAEEEDDSKWDSFKRIQMRPIFAVVGNNINTEYKAPVAELNLTTDYIEYKEDNNTTYEKLWIKFENEFKFIQNANFKTFSETLIALLHKYTTRIPASTKELPDVSLYDHLKTTAAFALCLYDYIKERNNSNHLPTKDEKSFLLIGGDLSGIQKFIYSITARGAAKNLKGRSFYLQLLIDNFVHYLIDALNLYSANIIYQSGGGFYIIAPNTESVKNKLEKIQNIIEQQLFKYHKTELYLAVDYLEFGEVEILEKNIGEFWSNLNLKLSVKKGQRFKNLIKENYKMFFETDKNFKPDTKRDYITGDILKENSKQLLDEDIPESYVNNYTYQQIELGKKLKNADYWIISKQEITYWKDKYFNPIGLGFYNYFVSVNDIHEKEETLKASADNIIIRRINNLDFLEPVQKGIENIYGFTLYGGNDYPKDIKNEPKLFEELAGVTFKDKIKDKREHAPDMVRLGILRMDVDNLGYIFKKGFSESNKIKPSFSRYSTLSRNLDLFFTGYINTIWESKEEFKNYTQIIYAGGDDIFVVGKWDILINFAIETREKFTKWTCGNQNIGISAGLAIVPPKFPLLKSAILAEEEEKNAKDHSFGFLQQKEKNSISIFGYAFRWDEEFNEIVKLKNEIKELLENKKIAQSFPSTIFSLMNKAYFEDKEKLVNFDESFKHRVKWLVAYNFKRAIARNKEDDTKEFLKKWSDNIFIGKVDEFGETTYNALQILAIAARWADYELRCKI